MGSEMCIRDRIGFQDFRIRLFHGAARIQITEGQMKEMLEKKERIIKLLTPYFEDVFLDLKFRQSE